MIEELWCMDQREELCWPIVTASSSLKGTILCTINIFGDLEFLFMSSAASLPSLEPLTPAMTQRKMYSSYCMATQPWTIYSSYCMAIYVSHCAVMWTVHSFHTMQTHVHNLTMLYPRP